MGSGVDKYDVEFMVFELLIEEKLINDVIVKVISGKYDFIVVNGDVIVVEIKLMEMFVCEVRFCNVLKFVMDYYDFVFIDCLFLLNQLMVNVLVVVDLVMVFMQCEYYVLEGFIVFMDII